MKTTVADFEYPSILATEKTGWKSNAEGMN